MLIIIMIIVMMLIISSWSLSWCWLSLWLLSQWQISSWTDQLKISWGESTPGAAVWGLNDGKWERYCQDGDWWYHGCQRSQRENHHVWLFSMIGDYYGRKSEREWDGDWWLSWKKVRERTKMSCRRENSPGAGVWGLSGSKWDNWFASATSYAALQHIIIIILYTIAHYIISSVGGSLSSHAPQLEISPIPTA